LGAIMGVDFCVMDATNTRRQEAWEDFDRRAKPVD